MDILKSLIAAFSLTALAQPISAEPFYVTDNFVPSGWMGDGEFGNDFVELSPANDLDNGKVPLAMRVEYKSGGPNGWAGIYWQNRDGNWGEFNGKDLSGYRCISFLAKGDSGNDVVEFKAGGIEALGRDFRDSFEASTGRIRVGREWTKHSIDLSNSDLTSVIGGFAVVMSHQPNAETMTVIFDDVAYHKDLENCES